MSADIQKIRELIAKELGEDPYRDPRTPIGRIPTGILSLDEILEGGLRKGSWVEFFGTYASGKSYLALKCLASAQRSEPEKITAYLDLERVWDPVRASSLGIDLDRVYVATPSTQETTYDLLSKILPSGEVSLVVVDSVSAMRPSYEAENETSKAAVATQAALNTKGLRKITPVMGDSTVILINQVRDNIGVTFGPRERTSGGRALLHFADVRLKVSRRKAEPSEGETFDAVKGSMEKGKTEEGHIICLSLEKARSRRMGSYTELYYSYELGDVPREWDLMNYLSTKGFLRKSGPFYELEGLERKLRGKRAALEYLRDDPDGVVSEILQREGRDCDT